MCKRTSRTVVCRLHAGAQDQLPPAASTRQQALLTSSPKLMLESRGHTSPHTPSLRVLVRRHEYFNTFFNVTLLVGCCHIRHIRTSAYARDSQFQSRSRVCVVECLGTKLVMREIANVSRGLFLVLVLVLVLVSRLFFVSVSWT